MLIESVRASVIEVPFSQPIDTHAGRWQARRLAIVRLGAASGVEGVGEVAAERPEGTSTPLDTSQLQSLVGSDATDVASADVTIDEQVAGQEVRSAIASAATDLLARSAGVSIATALVESPLSAVRVNALIGIDSPEVVAQQAIELAEEGFECFKLKATAEPVDTLLARVSAARAAVGDDAQLRLDFNGALDPASASMVLDALEPQRLEYVEQPLPADLGANALAMLRDASPVPIAADESVADLEAAQSLITAKAVDVFVVKPARVGGIVAAYRIARLAAAAEIAVVVSTLFESGIGVAAALQLAAALPDDRAHGLATAGLLGDDLIRESLAINDGRMSLPQGPGLGIELDEDTISARTI